MLVVCGARAIAKVHDGDFKLHWEFGRRFLANEFLYAGGHHIPYPPFWAMAHSPLALLPLSVAKALLFPLGAAALLVLLWTLRQLATRCFGLTNRPAFWAGAIALLLAGRFVVRDMAEAGVNTALVMLTWLAIYWWMQRRDALAGASLGLAVALKCTPAIFIAFFAWKRQWRVAGCAAGAALLFTVAPIVWQGPASYREHITAWVTNVASGIGSADPSVGVAGAEPLQNMSLRATLARYLMHLPPGHPGRAEHPLYADFFAFSPLVANTVVRIALAALVAGLLWWSRSTISDREDAGVLWELSAVSILMLLLSPITWGQHCVALLPPCYFVAAAFPKRGALPTWMLALLGLYILFVPVLSRDLVGREVSLLLASYHVETFAMLALLAVVIGCKRLPSIPAAA